MERDRTRREAYESYLRLKALLRVVPPDHPAHPHVVLAVAAAREQWLAALTGHDHLISQTPAHGSRRTTTTAPGSITGTDELSL